MSAELLQIIEQLKQENALLKEALAQRDRRIAELEKRVDYLCRQLYGVKSEKVSPDQLSLMLGDQPTPAPVAPPKTITVERRVTAKGQGAMRLPKNIPVEEVVIEPLEVQACRPVWEKVSEDRTETLDYQPGRLFKRVYVRPKYVRVSDRKLTQAPMPPRPIEKCVAEPGLLAQVVLSKYDRHQPLYRQKQQWELTQGVVLPRPLLSNWVRHVADLFSPVYGQIKREVFAHRYLQVDETPVRYLDEAIKGKCGQGYFWLYGHPRDYVWVDWQVSRGQDGPKAHLKNYEGRLQTDGYGVYESLCQQNKMMIPVGCWAHARRKFFEAQEEDPPWAGQVLALIGQLYMIERDAKNRPPPERKELRQSQAVPVLAQLHTLLKSAFKLPASGLGNAVDYALKRWTQLNRYVEDGELEIDNNLLENTIRPTAIGKKNWMFIGHPDAGQRSAILYTIILSCRRLELNPHAYIRDYLTQVPTLNANKAALLTPKNWSKASVPVASPVAACA